MKGGYVELDCGGLKVSLTSAQAITGIWDRAVNAIKSGKPLYLTNLFYGADKPITNSFSKAYMGSATAIIIMLDKYTITVANNNNVTVSNDIATAVNGATSSVAMAVNLDVETAQSVSGIFAKVKTAVESGKPVVLTGLTLTGNKALSPVHAYGYVASTTDIFLYFGVYELDVKNANTVTVSNQISD